MRIAPALICLTACCSLIAARAAGGDITVTLPIRFHLEKDHRTWLPELPVTNGPVRIIEWVVKGDSIDSWKELFDVHTLLIDDSIRKHLDTWRALMLRADPKVEISEAKNADDTVTVTYTSLAGDEMGISRYFKGKDGIYILSYRVRPKLQNAEVLKTWREIISTATLAPEHAGK